MQTLSFESELAARVHYAVAAAPRGALYNALKQAAVEWERVSRSIQSRYNNRLSWKENDENSCRREYSNGNPDERGGPINGGWRRTQLVHAEAASQHDDVVGNKLAVELLGDGVPVTALLDSGAMISLISVTALRKIAAAKGAKFLSEKIEKGDELRARIVKDVSGNTMKILGKVAIEVAWGRRKKVVLMLVPASFVGEEDIVLSMNALGACQEWREQMMQVMQAQGKDSVVVAAEAALISPLAQKLVQARWEQQNYYVPSTMHTMSTSPYTTIGDASTLSTSRGVPTYSTIPACGATWILRQAAEAASAVNTIVDSYRADPANPTLIDSVAAERNVITTDMLFYTLSH
uniref:Peptidase A2 domain-containing protein n=1 Tax=Ascaris lumbricoides TaxID=6252 RepID=A0A0M3IIP7_ASCLU